MQHLLTQICGQFPTVRPASREQAEHWQWSAEKGVIVWCSVDHCGNEWLQMTQLLFDVSQVTQNEPPLGCMWHYVQPVKVRFLKNSRFLPEGLQCKVPTWKSQPVSCWHLLTVQLFHLPMSPGRLCHQPRHPQRGAPLNLESWDSLHDRSKQYLKKKLITVSQRILTSLTDWHRRPPLKRLGPQTFEDTQVLKEFSQAFPTYIPFTDPFRGLSTTVDPTVRNHGSDVVLLRIPGSPSLVAEITQILQQTLPLLWSLGSAASALQQFGACDVKEITFN